MMVQSRHTDWEQKRLTFQSKFLLMFGSGRIRGKDIIHLSNASAFLFRALAVPGRLSEMQNLRPQFKPAELEFDFTKIAGDLYAP